MNPKFTKEQSFSSVLHHLAKDIPPQGFTIFEILNRLGSSGYLMLCMILTVPFLFPMSIPGTSTPFGLAIALIGLSIIFGKKPRLPNKIKNRTLQKDSLEQLLKKGAQSFIKMEKLMHPRLPGMTASKFMISFNGSVLTLAAVLLMFPLPIPFSNAIPAFAILLISAGLLQRDGVMILLGYLAVIFAAAYLGMLLLLGAAGLDLIFAKWF
ncbi:MAG: exopolysaccharide biosynthesis protein [Desulfitobacterium hafniense]|nr:exopolysaccharide biosynthesis protein [Desulfitobacterium hafniense]